MVLSQTDTDTKAVANQIADQLGEKQRGPRNLVFAVVKSCGTEFARQLLRDAQEIERLGGMLTTEGDRRRTIGGVFFYLARGRMSKELRDQIFPHRTKRKKQGSASTKPQEPEVTYPSFDWEERLTLVPVLLDEKGVVNTVKITLIGRPGKIEMRQDLVITTMAHEAKSPTLPKGVPAPPQTPTLYTVYIGAKQWRKVEQAAQNPDDALIIEGMCAFDEALNGMAVFATNVTSKAIETEKRDKKAAEDKGNGANNAAPKAAKQPASSVASAPAAAPAPVTPTLPANVSDEDAQKLSGLYAAADLYRQKIANLESKPSNQRFGLEMTQKLLKNTEDEIAAIEKKYA